MTSVFMHDGFKAMNAAKAKVENAAKSSWYAGKRKTTMNFVFVFHNVCDLTRRTKVHSAL